jgi:hypothetical protein
MYMCNAVSWLQMSCIFCGLFSVLAAYIGQLVPTLVKWYLLWSDVKGQAAESLAGALCLSDVQSC